MKTVPTNVLAAEPAVRLDCTRDDERNEATTVPFEHFFARVDKRPRCQAPSKQRLTKTAEDSSCEDSVEMTAAKTEEAKKSVVISPTDLAAPTQPLPPVITLEELPEPATQGSTIAADELISTVPIPVEGEQPSPATVPLGPDSLKPQPQKDVARIQLATQPAINGIDSAQYALQMKRTAKTGQNEQPLPNDPPPTGTPNQTNVEEVSPLQSWSREVALERATAPVNLASAYAPGAEPVATQPNPPPLVSVESRIAAVENHIEQTIVRFKQQGLDSLIVTIKPDADTQIRLSIARDGDGILVAAKLERGEFDLLSERWAGLQRDLQQRGVILGRIESAESNLPAGTSDQSQGGSHRQRSDFFREAEESDAATEALLKERLQRGRSSALTLTPVPLEFRAHGRAHFESWA